MSVQLNAAIKKAIRESLKGEVGDTLKTFIEEAEQDKAALVARNAELERANKTIEDLRKKISTEAEIQAKLDQTKLLAENAAEDRERALKERVETRALVAEAKLQATENVVNMVFRNTIIRESITRNAPIAVTGTPASQYGPGSPSYVQQGVHSMENVTRQAD